MSASAADDLRFAVPLYTAAEAARALDVPATTFATWAKGYVRHPVARSEVHGAPVVTALPAGQVDIVAIAEWLEANSVEAVQTPNRLPVNGGGPVGAGTEPLFMDPVAATRKRAADPNRQPAHKFLGRLYAGVPAGTDAQVGAALAELGAGCLRLRARRYWASAQRIPAAAQRGRMSPNRRCGLGPVGGLQFFTLWAWALTISMVDSIGRRAESATDRGLSGM